MKTLILTTLLVLSLSVAKAQTPIPVQNITQCTLVITEVCYIPNGSGGCIRVATTNKWVIPPGGGTYTPTGCPPPAFPNPPGAFPAYEICWLVPPTCPTNSGICVEVSASSICAPGPTAVLENECPTCTPHTGPNGANVSINPITGEIIVDRIL